MRYSIKALDEMLRFVSQDELASLLCEARVSKDLGRARSVIKSWRSSRGHVSTDGERVIRDYLEKKGVYLETRDFWDAEVWDREKNKYGILPNALSSQKVPA